MPIETISEDSRSRRGSGQSPSLYRQTIAPLYLRGSHAADDTDNHDYRFVAHGKGRLTVLVSSTGTSTHNVTVYGSHNTTGVPGEQGVSQITSGVVTGTTGGYLNSSGIFPHYIARVQTDTLGGEQGTGPTVNVFIAMSAFP